MRKPHIMTVILCVTLGGCSAHPSPPASPSAPAATNSAAPAAREIVVRGSREANKYLLELLDSPTDGKMILSQGNSSSKQTVEKKGDMITMTGPTGKVETHSVADVRKMFLVDTFTACKSNLKNIGTALEMYSTDNNGRYATSLASLTPNYLKTLPVCPAAAKDTYSGTFKSAAGPDAYTFMCEGNNHKDVGALPNFPQYNSFEGLKPGADVKGPSDWFTAAPTPLAACESNLKNIGTALEMYSTDNNGRYATSLASLTPNYLRTLPVCPAAAKDTYSGTFKSAAGPDAYTFMCEGDNHKDTGTPPNFPQYNSYEGLSSGTQSTPSP